MAAEEPVQPDAMRTGRPVDWERVHELLVKTSRTFALAIPVLPRPTVHEVTVACAFP